MMRFEDSHETISVKIEYNTQGDIGCGVQKMSIEMVIPKTFDYIYDCIDNFMNGLGKCSYYFETPNDRESYGQLKSSIREGILKNFADSMSIKYKTVYALKVKITGKQTGELKVSLKYA